MSQPTKSQSTKKKASSIDGIDLWLHGLLWGAPLSILLAERAEVFVKLYAIFFLLPALALLAFGLVGCVLGMLGCK